MELRKDLEALVVSTNTVLKEKVTTMDYMELLRNLHPFFRAEYARNLEKQGLLKKEQVKEFIN